LGFISTIFNMYLLTKKLNTMNENNQMQGHQHEPAKYFCPMKCEGEKTYDQPGVCPVCNMKLVPVGGAHHHH
jgi:hypothetical protein